MLKTTSLNPSVARGGSYQFQLTSDSSQYVSFGIVGPDPTFSSITSLGTFTAGNVAAGTCNVKCLRYDGESLIIPVTVT